MESYRLYEDEMDGKNTKKYELETRDGLTRICPENVYKVNAMIKSNSSYVKADLVGAGPERKKNRNKEGEKDKYLRETWLFDDYYKRNVDDKILEVYQSDSDDFIYIGSSAYWFARLREELPKETTALSKEKEKRIRYIVYKTVHAVDNENSTHLNADRIGRAVLSQRIFDLIKCGSLFDRLRAPDYTIIEEMSEKEKKAKLCEGFVDGSEKEGKEPRNYLSFVSKWCCNACKKYLQGEYVDNYAKVDEVVKKALLKYETKCKKDDLKFWILKDGKDLEDEEDKSRKKSNELIMKHYKSYIDIIDAVRTSDKEISRIGLDHLLWYANKGRENTDPNS